MHSVSINNGQITLNNHPITLPISLDELKAIIGSEPAVKKAKFNTIYTWHDDGIYAYSAKGKSAEGIAFAFRKKKTYDFTPTSVFQGSFFINNTPVTQLALVKTKPEEDHAELIVGDTLVFFDLNEDNDILGIELSVYKPVVIPEPDRYVIKPIAGKAMQFTDLNFKLAVIQVLMYEKELIKPVFDIFEFVKRYKARAIDTDAEGYEIIPEALQYFEQLPIDEALASEVDEIYQDGGNDIYMNIIPFWSGETDDFNIQSFDDTAQFPNLKTMTLFYNERMEEIQRMLLEKGIQAEPL